MIDLRKGLLWLLLLPYKEKESLRASVTSRRIAEEFNLFGYILINAITAHHITPLLRSHLPIPLMTGPQKNLTDEQYVTAAELVQTSRQNTASIN